MNMNKKFYVVTSNEAFAINDPFDCRYNGEKYTSSDRISKTYKKIDAAKEYARTLAKKYGSAEVNIYNNGNKIQVINF